MSTDIATTAMDKLHEVIERMHTLDQEVAKKSLTQLEWEREELRKRIGTVDVAIEFVRDARDQ